MIYAPHHTHCSRDTRVNSGAVIFAETDVSLIVSSKRFPYANRVRYGVSGKCGKNDPGRRGHQSGASSVFRPESRARPSKPEKRNVTTRKSRKRRIVAKRPSRSTASDTCFSRGRCGHCVLPVSRVFAECNVLTTKKKKKLKATNRKRSGQTQFFVQFYSF